MPRCPCNCHVCGLTLVSSPHLARSHHRHTRIMGPSPFTVRTQLPRVRPDAGVVAAPGALVPPHPWTLDLKFLDANSISARAQLPCVRPDAGVVAAPGALVPPHPWTLDLKFLDANSISARAQLPCVRPDAGVVAAPGALVPPPVPGARVCGGRRGRAGDSAGEGAFTLVFFYDISPMVLVGFALLLEKSYQKTAKTTSGGVYWLVFSGSAIPAQIRRAVEKQHPQCKHRLIA